MIHNPHSVLWPTTMRTQTTSFSRATFFHSLASHSRARVCPVTLNRFSPVFSQRHCWDLIYFHSMGFLLLFVFEATEFGTPAFISVQGSGCSSGPSSIQTTRAKKVNAKHTPPHPFRSTLNTGYITGLDMCKVCTEAVHSVAL